MRRSREETPVQDRAPTDDRRRGESDRRPRWQWDETRMPRQANAELRDSAKTESQIDRQSNVRDIKEDDTRKKLQKAHQEHATVSS